MMERSQTCLGDGKINAGKCNNQTATCQINKVATMVKARLARLAFLPPLDKLSGSVTSFIKQKPQKRDRFGAVILYEPSFIRTLTVDPGITPGLRVSALVGFYHRSGIGARRSLTLPRRN